MLRAFLFLSAELNALSDLSPVRSGMEETSVVCKGREFRVSVGLRHWENFRKSQNRGREEETFNHKGDILVHSESKILARISRTRTVNCIRISGILLRISIVCK
jgi:hypothetical protein